MGLAVGHEGYGSSQTVSALEVGSSTLAAATRLSVEPAARWKMASSGQMQDLLNELLHLASNSALLSVNSAQAWGCAWVLIRPVDSEGRQHAVAVAVNAKPGVEEVTRWHQVAQK